MTQDMAMSFNFPQVASRVSIQVKITTKSIQPEISSGTSHANGPITDTKPVIIEQAISLDPWESKQLQDYRDSQTLQNLWTGDSYYSLGKSQWNIVHLIDLSRRHNLQIDKNKTVLIIHRSFPQGNHLSASRAMYEQASPTPYEC